MVKKALLIWFSVLLLSGLVGGEDYMKTVLCLGLAGGGLWLMFHLATDNSSQSGKDKWGTGAGGHGGSSGCGGGCGGGD
ncbi:hypothetical protein [Micromonospora sp. NPDC047074]|uniref:hypothetical protein n=1 Tax=Micromonospora sp. NPDC047074 TaxID=3154339 RepID=UPI0033E9A777